MLQYIRTWNRDKYIKCHAGKSGLRRSGTPRARHLMYNKSERCVTVCIQA